MANTEIGGLVLVDGGFPNDYAEPVRSMPPLLLIRGKDDQTFPLSISQDLKRMVEGLGGPVDLDVYNGAGQVTAESVANLNQSGDSPDTF